MASNWNRFLDRLLEADLTASELRLALALGRLLLGWNQVSAPLGQRLLRKTARLSGWTFTRTHDALIEKRIIEVSGGGRGPGNRATYKLLLDTEMPAPPRANPEAPFARSQGTQMPAPARARIASRRGKASAPSAARGTPDLHRRARHAYVAAGGSLLLDRERGALARSVNAAAKSGTEETLIIAACSDLGRSRDFPGLLKQRIAELAERGGPCHWNGLDRSALTPTQLAECSCNACTEWAAAAIALAQSAS